MLTSPKLSPAACSRNPPVEHASHNANSFSDSLCPKMKQVHNSEFRTVKNLNYSNVMVNMVLKIINYFSLQSDT